jgi:hypothetical protein
MFNVSLKTFGYRKNCKANFILTNIIVIRSQNCGYNINKIKTITAVGTYMKSIKNTTRLRVYEFQHKMIRSIFRFRIIL